MSYIIGDREKAINSQLDFETALHTFRQKAKMNEIITLKLDCVNTKKSNGVAAVKTRVRDPWLEMSKRVRLDVVKKPEKPPEWFLEYMKKVFICSYVAPRNLFLLYRKLIVTSLFYTYRITLFL